MILSVLLSEHSKRVTEEAGYNTRLDYKNLVVDRKIEIIF